PFHGRRFDCSGANVEIPYCDRPNRAQSVRTWPVREVNGWILVWHHARGEAPGWEPPELPECSDSAYWSGPAVRQLNPRVRVHPQMVVENLVDAPHQQYVHRGSEPADIYDYRGEGPLPVRDAPAPARRRDLGTHALPAPRPVRRHGGAPLQRLPAVGDPVLSRRRREGAPQGGVAGSRHRRLRPGDRPCRWPPAG